MRGGQWSSIVPLRLLIYLTPHLISPYQSLYRGFCKLGGGRRNSEDLPRPGLGFERLSIRSASAAYNYRPSLPHARRLK